MTRRTSSQDSQVSWPTVKVSGEEGRGRRKGNKMEMEERRRMEETERKREEYCDAREERMNNYERVKRDKKR